MPQLSEDPVVDFAVLEAVGLRVALEDNERAKKNQEKQEHEEFRGAKGRKAWAQENGLA